MEMPIITKEAIGNVLKIRVEKNQQQLREYKIEKMKATAKENPYLFAFIQSGADLTKIMMGEDKKIGDEWLLFRGGYGSGSYLTLEMIEEQVRIDRQMLPKIIMADVNMVNRHVMKMLSRHRPEMAKWEELKRIQQENQEFGSYVASYALQNAPHEMIGNGFVIGAIGVYDVFREVYKRQG